MLLVHRNFKSGAGIETLENRLHFAVTISQSGSTLTIQGDSLAQNVELDESDYGTRHQTRVVADGNGNGTLTDPGDVNGAIYTGVTNVVVRLGGGADSLKIIAVDNLEGATRNYDIRTGKGSNTVSFSNPVGNDIRNSNISLSLTSSDGDDKVSLALNRIDASNVKATLDTGSGNDTVSVYAGQKVTNSTVDIAASLGAGSDLFEQQLDWEGFDLLGTSSLWRVSTSGGDGNDTLRAKGLTGNSAADVQGTLDIKLAGEGGDDRINFNLDRFNVRGGTLKLRGAGSLGNDNLSLAGTFETGGTPGTLDIQIRGGSGNDILTSSANASALHTYLPLSGAIFDGGVGANTGTFSGTLLRTVANVA